MIRKKSRLIQSLIAAVMLLFVIFVTKLIVPLPWWSFIIPVVLLGTILKLKHYSIPYFIIGFITGFMIWFGSTMFFDLEATGNVLDKLGNILAVHKIIIMAIAGVIGGLLSGLALYTGQLFVNVPVSADKRNVW